MTRREIRKVYVRTERALKALSEARDIAKKYPIVDVWVRIEDAIGTIENAERWLSLITETNKWDVFHKDATEG